MPDIRDELRQLIFDNTDWADPYMAAENAADAILAKFAVAAREAKS